MKWVEKKELPEGRADPTAATYKNLIYVIGGYNPNGKHPKNNVFIYNPKKDIWVNGAPMPTARWGMVCVEVDGKFFVFGGYNCTDLDIVEVYDPKENRWIKKTSLPFAGQGLMGVEYNGYVHLFYGKFHYKYDPDKDKYNRKSNLPTPRKWGVVAVVEDIIYVIGGIRTDTILPLSIKMKLDKFVSFSKKFGGAIINSNAVEAYYPEKDKWKVVGHAPFRLFGMGRENPVIDNKIYCTHGQSSPGKFSASCYIYDPFENKWERGPNAKYPRDGVGCATLGNELYVIGGRDFDPPTRGLKVTEVLVVR